MIESNNYIENKKLEYNDKQALEKLQKFNNALIIKDDMCKVNQIYYYDNMQLNINNNYNLLTKNKDVNMKNMYLVKKENKATKELTYDLYCNNSKNKIAVVDPKGNIKYLNKSMDKYLSKSSFDKVLDKNKECLKGDIKVSNKIKKDEKIEKNDIPKEENTKKNKINIMEKELGLDMNDIKSCSRVKTKGDYNIFRDMVPESKEFDMIQLVYLKKENQFKFVGKKKGKPAKFLETIEDSKATKKKSININKDGSKVEEKNIYGLMKLKANPNYDFSVNIGQYGVIELNTLRRDEITNRYIATPVETTTQKPSSRQIQKMMYKSQNTDISEEINKYDNEVQQGNKKVDVTEIADDNKKEEFIDENKKLEKKEETKDKNDEKEKNENENWGPWETMKPKKYEE